MKVKELLAEAKPTDPKFLDRLEKVKSLMSESKVKEAWAIVSKLSAQDKKELYQWLPTSNIITLGHYEKKTGEFKNLREDVSVIKAYGTKFNHEDHKATLPHFAKTKSVAQALASNTELGEVFQVELTISKPAKNADVEAIMSTGKYEEYSPAEYVAQMPKARAALTKKGFDGYADDSVLENTEPMQYVVFSESQVKYLDK